MALAIDGELFYNQYSDMSELENVLPREIDSINYSDYVTFTTRGVDSAMKMDAARANSIEERNPGIPSTTYLPTPKDYEPPPPATGSGIGKSINNFRNSGKYYLGIRGSGKKRMGYHAIGSSGLLDREDQIKYRKMYAGKRRANQINIGNPDESGGKKNTDIPYFNKVKNHNMIRFSKPDENAEDPSFRLKLKYMHFSSNV